MGSPGLLKDLKDFLVDQGIGDIGDLSTIDVNVADIEALLTTTNSLITTIDGVLDNILLAVDTVEASLSTIIDDIDGVEALLTTIDTSLNNIETDIAAIEVLLTTQNTTLSNIDTSLNNIEADADELNTSVNNIEANIPQPVSGELQVAVGTVSGNTTIISIGANNGIRIYGIRLGVESFGFAQSILLRIREVTSGNVKYRISFQVGESSEGGVNWMPFYVRATQSLELVTSDVTSYTVVYQFD